MKLSYVIYFMQIWRFLKIIHLGRQLMCLLLRYSWVGFDLLGHQGSYELAHYLLKSCPWSRKSHGTINKITHKKKYTNYILYINRWWLLVSWRECAYWLTVWVLEPNILPLNLGSKILWGEKNHLTSLSLSYVTYKAGS